MKKYKILCDICKKKAKHTEQDMQVIFTTEQNEGKTTEPYFEHISLDLCQEHFDKALAGNYIFVSGAMGHNEFWFNKGLIKHK